MKRLGTLPLLVALSFPLAGCGKFFSQFDRLKDGFTTVTVNHDAGGRVPNEMQLGFMGPKQVASAVLGGGILVYAFDTVNKVTFSGSIPDETGTLQLRLPNSTYAFYGYGWPTANLTDTATAGVRCGTAPGMTLSGVAPANPITISLADSTACYNSGFFAPTEVLTSSPIPTINQLSVEFCNAAASLSGLTPSSQCTGQTGSSYFFAGTANTDVGRAFYFPGSHSLAFLASHDKGTGSPPNKPYELFVTDVTTGRQRKVPLPVVDGYGVRDIAVSKNLNKVFATVQNSTGAGSLWAYDIISNTAVQVSQTPVSSALGVQEARVSPDGKWVAWVGDMDFVGRNEIYAIPAGNDGSSSYQAVPAKISTASISGAGVYLQCSSNCDSNRFDFQFAQGSTNDYLVYSAQNVTSTPNKLYIARPDGTSFNAVTFEGASVGSQPTGYLISNSEVVSGSDMIDTAGTTFDGSQLLYHARSGGVDKVYARQVSYDAASGNLTVSASTALVASGAVNPYVTMANNHNEAAIYTASGSTYTVWLVPDLTAPGTVWQMIQDNLSSVTTPNYGDGAFSSTDADFAVGFLDTTSSPNRGVDLWSSHTNLTANLNGHPVSYVSGPLASPKRVTNVGNGDHGLFQLSPDGTSVLFVSDQAAVGIAKVQLGVFGAGTPSATDISDIRVATAATAVTAAQFDSSGNVYYAANLDGTQVQLFRGSTSSPYTATPLNSRGTPASGGGGIANINQLGGGPDLAPGANKVVIIGSDPNFSGLKQAWLYDTAAQTYTKLISVGQSGSSPPGAGSYRISMLQTLDGVNFTTAFDSGCLGLNPSVQDGSTMNTQVRIPMGTLGTAPFATRIDVFPLAVGCAGAPTAYSFPNGIGTALNGTSGSRLVGSSSQATLFLNDKN